MQHPALFVSSSITLWAPPGYKAQAPPFFFLSFSSSYGHRLCGKSTTPPHTSEQIKLSNITASWGRGGVCSPEQPREVKQH